MFYIVDLEDNGRIEEMLIVEAKSEDEAVLKAMRDQDLDENLFKEIAEECNIHCTELIR